METVTIEKMNEQYSWNGVCVYEAIKWALQQREKYPFRPMKPTIEYGCSSIEAKQYAIDLEEWEKLEEEYKSKKLVCQRVENDINDVIIEYIKSESGLGKVPEQYRDKLYRIAYERGHSSGFYEVYQELCELVDIFN